MPLSVLATTIACVATSASGTAILTPFNLPLLLERLILSAEGAFISSATANVPITSPFTNFGKMLLFISSFA